MVLLLDVGNTRLKLSLYQPANPFKLSFDLAQVSVSTRSPIQHVVAIDLKELDNPQNLAKSILDLQSNTSQDIELVWGVSVAGKALNKRVEDQLQSLGLTIQWLQPSRHLLGLHNYYVNPDQLGADRWAATIGLHARFNNRSRPVILANFGTATTIDTLAIEARFLGGLILPGVDMMFESLARRTAQLPLAQGAAVNHPTDTDCAIVSGVLASQLGALKHQFDIALQTFKIEPIVCVSGGAWSKVEPAWSLHFQEVAWQALPHIVLEGLAAVAASPT
jgi:type III pantothenate kinase